MLQTTTLEFDKHLLIDKFVWPYSCGWCKRGGITDTHLLRCSNCKCVLYCGKDCQKEHFKKHKEVCGLLKRMLEFAAAEDQPQDNADWYRINMETAVACGPFKHPADQYFLRRPHCYKCCRTKKKSLVECRVCHSIAHCTASACEGEFEAAHPREACEKNALILAAWVMTMQQGGGLLKMPSLTREDTQLPADWAGYFAVKHKDFEHPEAYMQLPPITALLTSSTTNLLTAMHFLRFVPGSRELASMRIHFLGSTTEELIASGAIFEEFFHWFPTLRTLEVQMVGPEVQTTPVTEYLQDCAACKALNCRLLLSSENALYHASSAAQDIATAPPTLVLAENSGLHDPKYSESWLPTLRLLAQHNVPSVFTSYNQEEAVSDAAILRRVYLEEAGGSMTVHAPVRNPFRSLLPRVEPEDATVFYYNSDYATFCSMP
jgi:hypothetical protein